MTQLMRMQEQIREKSGVSVETVTDGMYIIGLVCVFLGLGLTAGWGWGLLADGGILIGTALWMVSPVPGVKPAPGKGEK
jgi:hypothetical protein